MAEQRGDGKPEHDPGTDIEPASAAQPAPAAPAQPPAPQLDPQQLREFEQFKQFQDYLRFTQAQQGNQPAPTPEGGLVPTSSQQPVPQQNWQPPVPAPQTGLLAPAERPRPRQAPRWLKRLGGKVLGWVLAFVLLAIAATWAYHQFFPSDAGKSSAQIAAEGGGTYHSNHIFSTNPYEAVRFVYHNIAQGRVDDACGRFSFDPRQNIDIQTKFARDMGQPDCQAAVRALATQVTSKNDYAESLPSSVSEPVPGDTVTIDSCSYRVKGGPALGVFKVSRVEKGQWIITGHSPGPAACPAPPSSAPPTS
ncbi:hypothetical protein ACFWY9_23410 [Amycolatopsis sp. NPDC059027]|uniref:hypothetical protein n=1 Tax=unclassified Amycolatopsis TaxID=2618356 RepID=UPI00366EB2C2